MRLFSTPKATPRKNLMVNISLPGNPWPEQYEVSSSQKCLQKSERLRL